VSTLLIRCPVCLSSQPVNKGVSPDKLLYCGNCQRKFAVKNGLPLTETGTVSYSKSASPTLSSSRVNITQLQATTSRNVTVTWIFGLMLMFMVVSSSRTFIMPMQGLEFIVFYLFLFFGVWFALVAMRIFWEDSIQVTLIALITFEAVGVVRYMDASAVGMHKFGFMIAMMVVGAILLFTRYDNYSGEDWSSGSGCSSSCSGCGSGCGGGCGGCGG